MSDQNVNPQTGPTGKVAIAPLPTSVDIGVATVADEKAVALTVSTPLGVQTYFFTADQAARVGAALARQSRDIIAHTQPKKQKLLVPEGGLDV